MVRWCCVLKDFCSKKVVKNNSFEKRHLSNFGEALSTTPQRQKMTKMSHIKDSFLSLDLRLVLFNEGNDTFQLIFKQRGKLKGC